LSRKLCVATFVCLIAMAAFATTGAAAAQRYADPDGAGTACTQPNPCSLTQALTTPPSGTEVIVMPGSHSYDIGSTIPNVPSGVDVHGQDGQARPTVTGSHPGGVLDMSGGSLRNVNLIGTGGPGLTLGFGTTSSVDGVISSTTVSGSFGCSVFATGTIKNSMCLASDINTRGIGANGSGFSYTLTLRNVTAVSSGSPSYGIGIDETGATDVVNVNATNVIASGVTSDAHAGATGGAQVAIALDHSDYATRQQSGGTVTTPGTGTNITSAPIFSNAAGGDFHETAGSPTVDAGIDDPLNGTTDFEGDPRTVGAGTDIGGDEYDVPPTAFDDSKTVAQDAGPTAIDVLANDTDPDVGPDFIQSLAQPAHGQVAITNSGADLTYQPNAGYCNNGSPTDDFTYTLNGGSTATVSVTVPCAAAPTPVAQKDILPPITTLAKGPKKHTTKHKAKFQFVSNEPGSSFMCKLDKKAFAACVAPKTVRVKTGKHTFKVEAVDPAGNIDPTPAVYHWKVLPK
jgi:Bacterial Ig domain